MPSNTTRALGGSAASPLAASTWTSGVPAPTWAFAITITWRTTPENGAVTASSIFIDSRTASRSPAAT